MHLSGGYDSFESFVIFIKKRKKIHSEVLPLHPTLPLLCFAPGGMPDVDNVQIFIVYCLFVQAITHGQ